VTNTPEGTPNFRQPIFSRRGATGQGPIEDNQLEVQVQEVTVNYLHYAEVVVQHSSKWQE
jgi:hypothetical protein